MKRKDKKARRRWLENDIRRANLLLGSHEFAELRTQNIVIDSREELRARVRRLRRDRSADKTKWYTFRLLGYPQFVCSEPGYHP